MKLDFVTFTTCTQVSPLVNVLSKSVVQENYTYNRQQVAFRFTKKIPSPTFRASKAGTDAIKKFINVPRCWRKNIFTPVGGNYLLFTPLL